MYQNCIAKSRVGFDRLAQWCEPLNEHGCYGVYELG